MAVLLKRNIITLLVSRRGHNYQPTRAVASYTQLLASVILEPTTCDNSLNGTNHKKLECSETEYHTHSMNGRHIMYVHPNHHDLSLPITCQLLSSFLYYEFVVFVLFGFFFSTPGKVKLQPAHIVT